MRNIHFWAFLSVFYLLKELYYKILFLIIEFMIVDYYYYYNFYL